jgi:hypothetical protein
LALTAAPTISFHVEICPGEFMAVTAAVDVAIVILAYGSVLGRSQCL